jgi:DNA-binding transcriptional regulator YdaS (Cro superfamily)
MSTFKSYKQCWQIGNIYAAESLWHNCPADANYAQGMGKAGKALKQVLEIYDISQNKLAVTMGVDRASVNRWVHELRDPAGEVIVEIKAALQQINPEAARAFVELYLGNGEVWQNHNHHLLLS